MKLYTTQEKAIAIYILAEIIQFIEDWENIDELKKELQKKLNKLALLL